MSQTLGSARTETEKTAEAAHAYAEEKGKDAKSSWWGWLGWGKSKAEDAKKNAAAVAAKGAQDVKESAAETEKNATKRSV